MPRFAAKYLFILLALTLVVASACSPTAAPAPTAAPQAPAVATAPAKAGTTPAVAPAPGATTPAAASGPAQTLTIGSISPTAGATGFIGIPFARGVEMAIEDINAKGGITVAGQKYNLKSIAYDDKYTAEGGAAAVQKAVYEDKIKFIVGPQGSAAVLAAQPVSEKEKVITLVASVTEKDTTPQTPYTIQGILSGRETTAEHYKVMRQKFPDLKTIAFINPNDETGWSDTERIAKEAEAAGFKVASKEFITRGTTDFYPALTKMIATNPDVIDFAATTPAGTPAKQARELGYKGKVWGAGVDAAALIQTGGPASEGYLAYFMAIDYYSTDASPLIRQLADRYKAKYNEAVTSFYWEQSYQATTMIAKAIETAQSLDTTKVAETIRKDGFTFDTLWPDMKGSFGGEKTYGIRSIVSLPFYITEIKSGKVTMLARTLSTTP